MPTTTVAELPYPADSDAPDVPSDLQALAEAIDAYVPVCIRKSGSETVTSSTTLQADNHLTIPLGEGEYRIQVLIGASGASAGDCKVGWQFTGTGSVLVAAVGPALGSSSPADTNMSWTTNITSLSFGIDSGSSGAALIALDLLYLVTAPGTWTFYWAQASSNATGTTLDGQSRMYVQKVVML